MGLRIYPCTISDVSVRRQSGCIITSTNILCAIRAIYVLAKQKTTMVKSRKYDSMRMETRYYDGVNARIRSWIKVETAVRNVKIIYRNRHLIQNTFTIEVLLL